MLFVSFFIVAGDVDAQKSSINEAGPSKQKTLSAPVNKPVFYKHPNKQFSLILPAGIRVLERDNGQLMLQSRRGYAISVQMGKTSGKLSLDAIVGKMESLYMGVGKPWAHKIGEDKIAIGKLVGRQVFYEGASTRTCMAVIKGKKNNFIFMFFAPITKFNRLMPEFSSLLKSFKPASNEVREEDADNKNLFEKKQYLKSLNKDETLLEKNSNFTVFQQGNYFTGPKFGYSIHYPNDWIFQKLAEFTTIFSGPKGTPAYDAMISVQNIQAKVITEAFLKFKENLAAEAIDLKVLDERNVFYARDEIMLEGRQLIVTYSHAGQNFKKWALVIPRPSGEIAYIWSYTAPGNEFERYKPIAEKMLKSWDISAS